MFGGPRSRSGIFHRQPLCGVQSEIHRFLKQVIGGRLQFGSASEAGKNHRGHREHKENRSAPSRMRFSVSSALSVVPLCLETSFYAEGVTSL